MKERGMQTFFTNHIKLHPPSQTETYELKICKDNKPLPFDAVQEHQVKALLAAEQGALFHRITDQPWMPDRTYGYTVKKPFDCLCLVGVKSFVVVWYYEPRKPRIFIKIPIKNFVKEIMISDRKSLTEERAKEIGEEFLCESS